MSDAQTPSPASRNAKLRDRVTDLENEARKLKVYLGAAGVIAGLLVGFEMWSKFSLVEQFKLETEKTRLEIVDASQKAARVEAESTGKRVAEDAARKVAEDVAKTVAAGRANDVAREEAGRVAKVAAADEVKARVGADVLNEIASVRKQSKDDAEQIQKLKGEATQAHDKINQLLFEADGKLSKTEFYLVTVRFAGAQGKDKPEDLPITKDTFHNMGADAFGACQNWACTMRVKPDLLRKTEPANSGTVEKILSRKGQVVAAWPTHHDGTRPDNATMVIAVAYP